jgi:uncharacterized protein (TIGR03435 family)
MDRQNSWSEHAFLLAWLALAMREEWNLSLGRPITPLSSRGDAVSGPLPQSDPGLAPLRAVPSDPSDPSIFIAVQEQLGLKLNATKRLVEILVIGSVERPSEK